MVKVQHSPKILLQDSGPISDEESLDDVEEDPLLMPSGSVQHKIGKDKEKVEFPVTEGPSRKEFDEKIAQLTYLLEKIAMNQSYQQIVPQPPILVNPVVNSEELDKNRTTKISLPEKYSGKREQFRGFITQFKMVLKLNGKVYRSEVEKTGLLVTLLTDAALKWVTPLVEKDDPLMYNCTNLMEAMSKVFDDQHKTSTAERKLEQLYQKNESCAFYASVFLSVIVDTEWNDAAKISCFRRGLNGEIKDALVYQEYIPEKLDDFVELCVKLDTRISERRLELGNQKSVTNNNNNNKLYALMGVPNNTYRSKEERRQDRLNKGLCLYCGDSGHMLRDCPKRMKQDDRRVNTAQTTQQSGNGQA